ncbi:MAG: hypothetical protein Q7Q73_18255 [Verrucomicrobiota bacterium JB024]|nr:hypothetical protein [Verrucomicrobiota bacterium JB024]
MRKKLIIIAVIAVLLIAGLWSALGWINRQQQAGALVKAREAYENGNPDRMVDLLAEAVAMDPDNLIALETQARLLDTVGNAGCVPVYQHLSRLQPGDYEALKTWLGAMVRYERAGDALVAYRELAGSGNELAGTPAFSLLGAELAFAAGDKQTALAYLREAYERNPDDAQTALRLCVAEAETLSRDELQPTMQRLDGLLAQPEVRAEAAALLLEMERQLGDTAAERATAERIWTVGRDDIGARLLALQVFYELDRPLFEQKLRQLITDNQRDVPALTAIFDWLLDHNENDLIITLAQEDSAVMNLNRPPVANRVAEAMIRTDQLKALRSYNSKVDWTGAEGFASLLPPLTRTLDRVEARNYPNPAFTRWLGAATLPQLREVLLVTQRLGFEKEEAAILQEIIRDEPWDRDAYLQLYALRERNRDSLGMLKLLQEARANFPQDRDIGDEYAWMAMVLDVERRQAEGVALRNFSYDPENTDYRVTWALAQCMKGEPDKALTTLDELKELPLRGKLAQSLAYRLLGQEAEARSALAGVDVDALLPEERKLVLESRPLPQDE